MATAERVEQAVAVAVDILGKAGGWGRQGRRVGGGRGKDVGSTPLRDEQGGVVWMLPQAVPAKSWWWASWGRLGGGRPWAMCVGGRSLPGKGEALVCLTARAALSPCPPCCARVSRSLSASLTPCPLAGQEQTDADDSGADGDRCHQTPPTLLSAR